MSEWTMRDGALDWPRSDEKQKGSRVHQMTERERQKEKETGMVGVGRREGSWVAGMTMSGAEATWRESGPSAFVSTQERKFSS